MVILATTATIIASQAVITGAFSLTQQAVQMNYLPRLRIVHTSAKKIGQIYVPVVNWFLMVATIGLVAGFQSSSKLAAAYGVAVTSTMVISTILFYVVAREKLGWGRLTAGIPAALFLLVDLSFFGANVSKILHGAWFPLVIGAIVYTLMNNLGERSSNACDPNQSADIDVQGLSGEPSAGASPACARTGHFSCRKSRPGTRSPHQ